MLGSAVAVIGLALAAAPAGAAPRQTPPADRPVAPVVVNVNTASESELRTLPGIGHEEAVRIIAGRPYQSPSELRRKARLPDSLFDRGLATRVAFGNSPPPGQASPQGGRFITTHDSPPPPEPRAPPPANRADRLDLNRATREQLEKVPGLGGPVLLRILQRRPYRSLADLSRAGLGRRQIVELSQYIKVGAGEK